MTTLGGEAAHDLLRTMWRIRVFEERVGQLKQADQVYGLIHLSLGQESVAAGVCRQLRDDDAVYSGHRAHGHAIAKGVPLDRLMAELMGREDGLCRGLGGSMHLVDVEHGLLGATGVVGGNIPIALGSALAVGMFLTTLSFLVTTPGVWASSAGGFPALSAFPGQALIKDLALLGISLWSLGEAWQVSEQRG